MPVLDEIRDAIINGQVKVAVAKVEQGLKEGISAEVLLTDGKHASCCVK